MRALHGWVTVVVTGLAIGCSTSTVDDVRETDAGTTGNPVECAQTCRSWQECSEGECRPAVGRCDVDRDCPSYRPECDSGTHKCVEATATCTSCAAWQQCSAGTCVASAGRCGTNADCPTSTVCNPSTNTCVAPVCSPACAEWQSCTGTACALAPGRCATNDDCSRDQPICNATHRCEAPVLDQPKALVQQGLIITSDTLKASFERLALIHTLTGIPTRVVTVQQICAATTCSTTDPKKDAPKAIKDYILAQRDVGIVVIGGDIEQVPSRFVHDHFANAILGVDFEETFPTDYYYSDTSAWDGNGNGVYAEKGVDSPDLMPERGVTRIPASTVVEVERYTDKVLAHLTDYNLSRVLTSLFLSNVATSFDVAGVEVPIDGAVYYVMDGRTLSLVPPRFAVTKLFAVPPPRIEQITLPREIEELQKSHNIVVHNGHGWVHGVTSEIDGDRELTGDMAYDLVNTQYPFFLSCACDAGKFSANDSAGENLVNAPRGGALGYLGNSATGLGLAGGAQFVDEFLRYTFSVPRAYAGDAMRVAHEKLSPNDSIPIPVPWLGDVNVPVVDADSWAWTEKGVVYLGDGLVPIWTDGSLGYAPDVVVTQVTLGRYTRLNFKLSRASTGTLRVQIGANTYELPVNGTTTTLTLNAPPGRLTWGFQSMSTIAGYGEETF